MNVKSLTTLEGWQGLIRQFKETLAKRLWAMPTVSEAEKELVFKEYLSDLDKFETEIAAFQQEMESKSQVAKEENDLLRSLLGIPGDELKTRALSLTHDLNAARAKLEELEEEIAIVKEKLS